MLMMGDNFVFVENPKTASTSIRNMLENAGGRKVYQKHRNLSGWDDPERPLYRTAATRAVFVRHPLDRMVSGFHHTTGGKQDFAKWLTGDPWMVLPGVDFKRTSQLFWTARCNMVMRFENIEEELETLRERVGYEKTPLPKINVRPRAKPDFRDYYDTHLLEIMRDRFMVDFEVFGYDS
jgi:hypothetical protein